MASLPTAPHAGADAPTAPVRPGPARRPGWSPPVTLGALALGGTALLAVVDPSGTHVPLCPLKAATGLDCPFCGGLRAVHALTGGDLARAADHNVLFVAALPLLVAGWALWLRRWPRPVAGRSRSAGALQWAAVAVLVAFALARNLEPLAWMASDA